MITKFLDYDIKPHAEVPTCYIVVTSGKGGKIPDCLTGLFTSRTIAMNAVAKYVESKPKKD